MSSRTSLHICGSDEATVEVDTSDGVIITISDGPSLECHAVNVLLADQDAVDRFVKDMTAVLSSLATPEPAAV